MIDTPFFDVHTHHLPDKQTTAILNCHMTDWPSPSCQQARFISASLHPWTLSSENLYTQLTWLEQLIQTDTRVVALGEAGLDKICSTPFSLQLKAFKKMVELSEKHHLPLILHAVKSTAELLAVQKEIQPSQPWIIHGFRGKKELAEELIRHGFYLSFGKKYNEQALSFIPQEKLFLESDEEETDFHTFYQQVASTRDTLSHSLAKHIKENANRLFFNR